MYRWSLNPKLGIVPDESIAKPTSTVLFMGALFHLRRLAGGNLLRPDIIVTELLMHFNEESCRVNRWDISAMGIRICSNEETC